MDTGNSTLTKWIEKEKKAIKLISVVSELWFDHSVELILFRRPLADVRVSEVLNNHLYAKNFVGLPITIDLTLDLAKNIAVLNLAPSRIDLGKLASEWLNEKDDFNSIKSFLETKLAGFIGEDKMQLTPKDVVLYGFGRIGRLAARVLATQAGKGEQLRLKAIVVRKKLSVAEELRKRATLLRKDSIHGKFQGTVTVDNANESLIINGHPVRMIFASKPSEIDYTSYGINDALIIDNTGVWKTQEDLEGHLVNGASKVLLTAPAGGDIPNIVYGVNNASIDTDNYKVLSAASCTTNAIAPVLKIVMDNLGIHNGHLETIHAYTNDQNLIDNFHKKDRRGRAAGLNMVITSTGAATAVGKVIPEIKGKLTGSAVRVPTPNVSLAILKLNLEKETTTEALNSLLNEAAKFGELSEQIHYSTSREFVSSDGVGNSHTSIVDARSTIVTDDGKSCVLYVWYDNEYGYTRQVIRFAKQVAKVRRLTYY